MSRALLELQYDVTLAETESCTCFEPHLGECCAPAKLSVPVNLAGTSAGKEGSALLISACCGCNCPKQSGVEIRGLAAADMDSNFLSSLCLAVHKGLGEGESSTFHFPVSILLCRLTEISGTDALLLF